MAMPTTTDKLNDPSHSGLHDIHINAKVAYGLSEAGSAAANTTALQNAIDAAESSLKPLYIPAGTYDFTDLTVDSDYVHIYGDGKDSTILNYTGSAKAITVDHAVDVLNNCYITDLKISDGGTGTHGIYFGTYADDMRVLRCHITGFDYGLYFDGANTFGFLVQDCALYTNGWGLYKTGISGHNTVKDCDFNGNTTGGLYSEYGLYMEKTRFENHTNSISKLIYIKGTAANLAYNLHLDDIWIENNTNATDLIYLEYCRNTLLENVKTDGNGTNHIHGIYCLWVNIIGGTIGGGTKGVWFDNNSEYIFISLLQNEATTKYTLSQCYEISAPYNREKTLYKQNLVVQTRSDHADPVARFNQVDIDQPGIYIDHNETDATGPLIRFDGVSAADSSRNVSTQNGNGTVDGPKNYAGSNGWTYAGMIKVNINGNDQWMPFYSEDTS